MGNYIFIGFMGSGKSSLGRFLSKKYGYQLIDTDELIEKQEGTFIRNIFEEKGESYFRDLETQTIQKILENMQDKCVISVGGGLPMREENRVLLKQLGTIVYLKARPETLEKRLSGDQQRPLLKGAPIREKIISMMKEREDTYLELADYVVATDNRRFTQIYKEIRRKNHE